MIINEYKTLFHLVEQEIHELTSNQEETDIRVVLYLKFAVEHMYKSTVLRIPDSYIFFILLHHAHTIALNIYLDIGSDKYCKITNVSEITESKGEDD